MNFRHGIKTTIAIAALCFGFALSQFVSAQAPAPPNGRGSMPGQQRGGGMFGADPRAKTLTYHFKEADEDMQYCLFVSSKVSKDKKAPLIVTLHGMGAGPTIMVSKAAVDLAEEGGYILVSPMGYNTNGWYGSMPGGMSGMRGAPGARSGAPKSGGGGMRAGGDGSGGPGAMGGMLGGGEASGKDTNALSEKDVLNVLDIVLKEYKIDEKRMYLMGHSMGGAGTLHLGTKYPDKWAALAAAAPAAFTSPDVLKSLVGKGVPVLIMRGNQDTLIGATVTQPWVDKLKELNIFYEYKEIPGVEHGGIITACLPAFYDFFAKHSKK